MINPKIVGVMLIVAAAASIAVTGTAYAINVTIDNAPSNSEIIMTVNSTDYSDYKTLETNHTAIFNTPEGLPITACAHVQLQTEHLEGCSTGLGPLNIHLEKKEIHTDD